MKKFIFSTMFFCLLVNGCVSTKTIMNYKEKDDNRISIIKQCYGAEKAKRPNSKYIFPMWKSQWKDCSKTAKSYNDGSYYALIALYPLIFWNIPTDIVSTIFISPFTKTASTEYGKIILSGQLVDENNNPIKNYNFDTEWWNNVVSDDNGYFFKEMELNGSYKKNITITFLKSETFTKLSNDFNEGKSVSITNPYKIKYSIEDDGKIKIEEGIIEIKEHSDSPVANSEVTYENRCYISSDSFKDSLVVNWHESNNLKSDKIVLKKTELFSETNKQRFIEAQKAEEKREAEAAIQREKDRIEKEKREKKILKIIDKLENTKDVSQYSIHDIQTALNRFGMKYDEEAYKALMEVNKGTFVCFPMQILQVMQNGLLLNYPNSAFVIYVDFNKTETLYDGKWIRIKGKITGTYRYVTSYGTVKTVPKVYAYIISDVSEY